MKRWFWIILIALTVLLAVLIATLPAAVAWGHLATRVPDLQLQSLSGTIWNGAATSARVRGVEVGSVSWRLSPLSLFSHPSVELTLDGDVDLSTTARFVDGQTELSGLKASADASWLAPALAIPELKPSGTLTIDAERVLLGANGLPLAIEGNGSWRDALVEGRARAELGQIDLSAKTRDGTIVVAARDDGRGALIVNGTFEVRDGRYQGRVALTPRSADEPLQQALQWIGAPQPDGSRLLLVEGQIRATEVSL